MGLFNFIFVLVFFTSYISTFAANDQNGNIPIISKNQKTLPTEDFTTIYHITDYDSILNISAVSLTNDPNEYLLLYYNISQEIKIPGLSEYIVSLEKSDKESPYTDTISKIEKHNELLDPFRSDVFVNISITITEIVQRDVDFSNVDKRSRIEYDLTIATNTTVTWNTESTNGIRNLPSSNSSQMNVVLDDFSAFTPLANATGHDSSVCQNLECSSSTEPQEDFDSYTIFDNISLYNQKKISTSAESTLFSSGENTTFSMLSEIQFQYIAVIGEHRC